MIKHGIQEKEAEQHKLNIESRGASVKRTGEELGIVGYERNLSDEQVKHFISIVKMKSDGMLKEAKQRKEEDERREDELQGEINNVREERTKLESKLRIKNQDIDKKKGEQMAIKEKLSLIESSTNKLDDIQTEIRKTEKALDDQEGSLDANVLMDEINELEEERVKLDEGLRNLDLEFQRMCKDQSARTQMEILKKEKLEKERSILQLRDTNEDVLRQLLGYIPTKNFGPCLEEYIRTQKQEVISITEDIQKMKMELSALNARKDCTSEQLKDKEIEVTAGQEEVISVCGEDDFEKELRRVCTTKDSLMDKKNRLQASERMCRDYVSSLQEENPPCPLCKRSFDRLEEVQNLLKDLTNQMSEIPRKIKEVDDEHQETKTKFEAMTRLKPTKEKIAELQRTDIPELKSKLAEMTSSIEGTKSDIQKKENRFLAVNTSLEVAQGIHPSVVQLDTYQHQLASVDTAIEEQSARIPAGDSSRTMQQVSQEKQMVQRKLDSVVADLESKTKQYRYINSLKTQSSQLTVKKLQIEKDLQHQATLAERRNQLNEQVESLENEVKAARLRLSPLGVSIENLETQRRDMTTEKNERYEQEKEKASKVKAAAHNIELVHNAVESYNQGGKENELLKTKQDLDAAKIRVGGLKQEGTSVQTNIEQIKEELANQEVKKRNIEDNLALRTKEQEATDLGEQIKEDRKRLYDLKPKELESEMKRLHDEKKRLSNEKSRLDGTVAVLRAQIADQRRDLQETPYAKAEEKYRNTMEAVRTKETACSDLDKNYEALDSAVMRDHKDKMTTLNKTIDERWKNTYKGHDIDTIKIQCDEEEGSGAAKRRRIFNYRVQMVKGDMAIDMRGRCSAGQKVLASLIIRLALAETFSSNCPFLALDDPTINLDRENMESLASSLARIIKDRRDFQLLVITHSEDFVNLLRRADCIGEFLKVSKSDDGYSSVKSAGLQDLHL